MEKLKFITITKNGYDESIIYLKSRDENLEDRSKRIYPYQKAIDYGNDCSDIYRKAQIDVGVL